MLIPTIILIGGVLLAAICLQIYFWEKYGWPIMISKEELRKIKMIRVCSKCGNRIHDKNSTGICRACFSKNNKYRVTDSRRYRRKQHGGK